MAEDAEEEDEIIASLGNLLYVSEELNKKLANKKFADKKQILKNAGLKLDPVLAKASTWNRKAIQEREQYLAELAYNKIWRL